MAKEYSIVRADRDPYDTDAKDYLARTILETDETYDIGLKDAAGNKIVARKRMDQIGFVRFPTKA